MNTLRDYFQSGALKPHVSVIFPFTQMVWAQRKIEPGRTVGKALVRGVGSRVSVSPYTSGYVKNL